jgi:hypothetical protein
MTEKQRREYFDDDSNWYEHLVDRDFRVRTLIWKGITFYRLEARETSVDWAEWSLGEEGYDEITSWVTKGYEMRRWEDNRIYPVSITQAREAMKKAGT